MVVLNDDVLTWKLNGKSGNIKSQNRYSGGDGYNLFCQTNRRFLTYERRVPGINLGYTTSEERKTHFRLPDRSEREILSGELVALGVGGGRSFLRYSRRRVGINLKWSSSPVFEWRIFTESGRRGESIANDTPIAIVNENVRPRADFLIYLQRFGADIGWVSSPFWWNILTRI